MKVEMTRHAKCRLVERYNGVVSKSEILLLVLKNQYKSHIALTGTRTLCSVRTSRGPVFFVYSKRKRTIITILSRCQARNEFTIAGRTWPDTGKKLGMERRSTLIVEQLSGPDTGDWCFGVGYMETPDPQSMKYLYTFTVPRDVGVSEDYILELAWENAPEPDRVCDIMLSIDLHKMLGEECGQ